jgi:hypothetical protein
MIRQNIAIVFLLILGATTVTAQEVRQMGAVDFLVDWPDLVGDRVSVSGTTAVGANTNLVIL